MSALPNAALLARNAHPLLYPRVPLALSQSVKRTRWASAGAAGGESAASSWHSGPLYIRSGAAASSLVRAARTCSERRNGSRGASQAAASAVSGTSACKQRRAARV